MTVVVMLQSAGVVTLKNCWSNVDSMLKRVYKT